MHHRHIPHKAAEPIEEEDLCGINDRTEEPEMVDDEEEDEEGEEEEEEEENAEEEEEDEMEEVEEDEEQQEVKMKIKCGSEVRVLTVVATINYAHLLKTLQGDYGDIESITYEDAEGDTLSIRSQHDLTQAFDYYLEYLQDKGTALRLSVVKADFVRDGSDVPIKGKRQGKRRSDAGLTDRKKNGGIVFPSREGRGDDENLDADAPDFKWQKGNLIGKGAVGSVYLGMVQGKGTLMAVKVVELGELDKENSKEAENLERELQLMKLFKHENIVRYYGCKHDKEHNQLNIFLEYVPGGSLASLVKKFGCLPEDTVRHYTRQILGGLMYLHDNGIVHRDIKGDNILAGDDGTVKLADFGCSKQLNDLANNSHGCSTMVGTPYWMAPEVITDDSGYGPKADIWSVGCTIIEMMTGSPPWPEFQSMWAAIYHIANSEGPPTGIPEDLTPVTQEFLDCCFERDVERRGDCSQLLAMEFCKVFL
eukprot:EG_transcript_5366